MDLVVVAEEEEVAAEATEPEGFESATEKGNVRWSSLLVTMNPIG